MYLSYSRTYSESEKIVLKRQLQNNINFASGSFDNKKYYLEQIDILNNRLELLQKSSFIFKFFNRSAINKLKGEISDLKFKLNLIEDENI